MRSDLSCSLVCFGPVLWATGFMLDLMKCFLCHDVDGLGLYDPQTLQTRCLQCLAACGRTGSSR